MRDTLNQMATHREQQLPQGKLETGNGNINLPVPKSFSSDFPKMLSLLSKKQEIAGAKDRSRSREIRSNQSPPTNLANPNSISV